MTPDPHIMRSPAKPSEEASRVALLRLQLKPDVPLEALVDGAWWPRSLDLSRELPALVSRLSDRIAEAALVVFDKDAWDDVPQQLQIDEQVIRLEGAASQTPDRVTVVGADGQRLTLLVVAPDATAPEARQSLADASSPTSDSSSVAAAQETARTLDEVAERLARHEGANGAGRTAQIHQWVGETAKRFDDAPIQNFVPILVEHIVRVRMAATSATG